MTEINLGMPEAPPPVLNPRRKTRQPLRFLPS